MSDLPVYAWTLTLIGVLGIPAATVAVLHRGAREADLGRRTSGILVATAGAALAAWSTLSLVLAADGAFRAEPPPVAPWLVVVILAGLAGMLAATAIGTIRRALSAPGTLARLTLPHTLRVVGVVFLIVMAQGHLPAAFALPAGLGDIAVGVTAPVVARRLAADPARARSAAVRFHLLGILDLLVAAAIGFVLFGIVDAASPTAALRALPLVLVPTVPVPLAMALHLTSLRQLRHVPRAPRVSRRLATARPQGLP